MKSNCHKLRLVLSFGVGPREKQVWLVLTKRLKATFDSSRSRSHSSSSSSSSSTCKHQKSDLEFKVERILEV
jgi:hypothetical protein